MRHHQVQAWLAVSLLSCLPLSAAEAQSKTNRLAASDVFNLEFASDPQISPDGQRIIYVRQFSDVMSDKNYANLWIIDFDGTNHRPLTTGHRGDSSPRWSPDGTRIIYLSDQDGTPQIYLRWLDTGQTAKLTNLQHPPAGIAWSPDGRWVSFASFVPAKGPQIAQVPAAPSGAKWAEPATVIDKLVYRFNGPGYLKPGYNHLFVVPADGGTPRQISSGNFHHGDFTFRASEAVWSPDGKSLLVSANRRPDYELEPLDTEIYEFSVADGSVKALTHRRGPDNSPAVSPDGQSIAFLGFDDKYQGYQVTRLYVMNRDGTNARVLSGDLDRDVIGPRWTGDNKGVFIRFDDQGNTKLAFYTVDGKLRQIAQDIGGGSSAYAAGSFSISPNGHFAFTCSRLNLPVEVGAGTLADPKVRILTALNEDLLADKTLGHVEEIWYESSLDKRKIQGWIIKPPGFDPAKKYPLILEIHGGPFANYGDRFDVEKQVWAAKGYVVFYANPRGSTSYGGEFGNLIHHRYPGDDFYDLNSGVDAVMAKGYIDAENLFVTGGSGGGVLTCWMIGRTNRFRAAASAYPVINWYSFVLTADISAFVAKYWFPGLPWENVEHYEKRSLLSVVKNVKTPTMVITGEEDYRTPMSESEQYYQALKLLQVESVLVRVPGEPHGIRRRPSHWMAKMAYIEGWFEQHKK
ncbi:MAG: S9 family peptidase [Verrucomicrobia bacterium]|nr:S9 family peptidase [Verrucomicrobiota bacterium]